ncbi:hypothetical protein HHK36_000195 [Tetracentron sinense]|uniref:Hydroxyproline-rich glycoprotein family protein n=1 Tax=Tetracentron sinense TaxID=13715 RepID=A0A834ZRI2_TETSI|nr:hypothetical protein HHK36_000195 [Tetracentron sinense]
MRRVNDSADTINAAANAIVNSETRVPRAAVQKRRWGSCWSVYWCFGSHRDRKRISHAVLIPEPTVPGTATENTTLPPTTLPTLVAPPSSPASFLQSEPPSAAQSPTGLLSFTSLSANIYSPSGPASIFAIGPYAYETQLVSPPVFSTEPSTAPFTPPPESIHLTTPSSPEVPFAWLLSPPLESNHINGEACQKFPLSNYEFQSYQLFPGSPIGHLISPSSVISGSGTSSPFPDSEFTSCSCPSLEFHIGNPPKLWSIEGFSAREWRPRQASGSLTPDAAESFLLESQISVISSQGNSENEIQKVDNVVDHRVSFGLSAEEVASCVEKEPAALVGAVSESLLNLAAATTERKGIPSEAENGYECHMEETSNKASGGGKEEQCHQKCHSLTLGSVKEFNFDSADIGASDRPLVSSDWWANEKVLGKESQSPDNWAFFHMMQPGIS